MATVNNLPSLFIFPVTSQPIRNPHWFNLQPQNKTEYVDDTLTYSFMIHFPIVSGPTLGEARSHGLRPYRGVGGRLFKKKRINKIREKNGALVKV